MSFSSKLFGFYSRIKRGLAFLFSSRGYYYRIGLALLVVFIFLLRACSFSEDSKRTYSIGRDNRRYWVNLMGKERSVGAFSDELLSNIGKEEHLTFNIYAVPFEEALISLKTEHVDGVLSSLQPEKISADYLYSDSYFLLGPVLVIQNDNELNKVMGEKRKVIGISSHAATALEMTKDTSSVQLQLYDDDLHALAELKENQIDGVILPALAAYTYVKTFYPKQLKIVTTPLTTEGLRLIALKNDNGKTLIDHFNKGLKVLKEKGTYDKLIASWGLVNAEKLEEDKPIEN